MSIYDYIYQFLEQHIFLDNYGGLLGLFEFELFGRTITLDGYLCTITTIICMFLIVAFAIWLVRWVFKTVTSAFLLK